MSRRDIDGISRQCDTGLHGDCLPPCERCLCHPRLGKTVTVRATEPVQTACRGATFRAEVAPY